MRCATRFRDATLLIKIDVDKRHCAGVDISKISAIEDEEEVLLSCFTRFEVISIEQDEYNITDVVMTLKTSPPKYRSIDEWKQERNIREEIANASSRFEFDSVLKICKENKQKIPDLINSPRPSSSKFYTALHQAAWQRNTTAMKELIEAGANQNCWNHKGITPEQVYNDED